MERLPNSTGVVPYQELPQDWMAPGEVAQTFGLVIDVPSRQESQTPQEPQGADALAEQSRASLIEQTEPCERRPQSARIIKVIATLGLQNRLGRLKDGRVTRYVTPQEANQIFDYLFADNRNQNHGANETIQ